MKTGIILIVIGADLFLLAAFVLPLACIIPLLHQDSADHTFLVPGTAQLTVQEPGRYYLWNKYQSIYQGQNYQRSRTLPDGITIEIRNRTTGQPLEFISDTSTSSTIGNSAKNSIGYVKIETPTDLEIEVAGTTEERVFSFSPSNLTTIFATIAGTCCLSTIFILAAITLIIIGIVKLVRSNKTNQTNPPQSIT